jgi:hypothetical protein
MKGDSPHYWSKNIVFAYLLSGWLCIMKRNTGVMLSRGGGNIG